MKKYIILTETGADLPEDLVKEYGIYVIPMHVSFGEETKDDGSFPITELFDYYVKSGQLPKTSACNAYEFEQMFDRIHAQHPDAHILYLAYSAVTTCTYASALQAMEGRDYITAFDTKFASAGEAFVISKIAEYVRSHEEAEISEILAYAEDMANRTRMGFFPGDLDYLRAGGRVSNAAYLGAKILSLNPLIEFIDGYLIASKKYRGKMEKVTKKLLREYTEKNQLEKEDLFLIYSHGLSEKLKAELVDIARELGFERIRWVKTGAVVSTHSGPGAFGIAGLHAAK